MLWVALHFRCLCLEALLRGHAASEPWAVVDGRTVLACDANAGALGVRQGMALAAARAMAPGLRTRPRSPQAERKALEGIAAWLGRFTPRVSLEPPDGIVAEVQGSLRLFGGASRLAGRMRHGLASMGFSAALAMAPTARGAWWLARADREALIRDQAALETTLAELPLAACGAEEATLAFLEHIGVRRVGELLVLPREGLARRVGQSFVDVLDRALGRAAEARAFFTPPQRFEAELELLAEVIHAEGVLFAANRLLAQLEGVLIAHQAGVREFTLRLLHRHARPCSVVIGLASPGRSTGRLSGLLREKLDGLALAHPVGSIRIEARGFVPMPGASGELFRDPGAGEERWEQILERLQARFGSDAVHCIGPYPDHRPEFAWRALGTAERRPGATAGASPRPLWLIEPPRRLREVAGVPQDDAPLELLTGPERIESGWWDDADVARDYFIARAPDTALLWVFREPGGGWYLHGIFA